jgi:hypothetical protein
METGTRSGLIPIRGANPHGAAYSFNVIPGKKNTYGLGIRQKIKEKAGARYMANGGTFGIA